MNDEVVPVTKAECVAFVARLCAAKQLTGREAHYFLARIEQTNASDPNCLGLALAVDGARAL